MMLERQREGWPRPRPRENTRDEPTSDAIRQEVIRLAGEGTTKAAIASQLRIGEATMYRILAGSSKPEVLSLKRG